MPAPDHFPFVRCPSQSPFAGHCVLCAGHDGPHIGHDLMGARDSYIVRWFDPKPTRVTKLAIQYGITATRALAFLTAAGGDPKRAAALIEDALAHGRDP